MTCFKKESSTKSKKPHRDDSSGITLSKVIASLGVQRQAFMRYVYTRLGLRSHSNSSKAEKCFRSRDTTMVISENNLKGATHSLTSIQPCPCLKWLKKNLDLDQQTTFNQSNHSLYSGQDPQIVEQMIAGEEKNLTKHENQKLCIHPCLAQLKQLKPNRSPARQSNIF